MPTLLDQPPPCRCTRDGSICAPCWSDYERSLTEGQLRRWLELWDANGSGPKLRPVTPRHVARD